MWTEFARYITTYGREGQWLTDVSPFLFMIKEGGTFEFKFSGANKGGLHLVALLSNWNDDGLRPTSGEFSSEEETSKVNTILKLPHKKDSII